MRLATIGFLIAALIGGPAAAQVQVQPPSWQKKPSMRKIAATDDAKARGRAAYLADKSPEALIAEVRAAHPTGGDEIVATALKEARVTGKAEVDELKALGEQEALRLQAATERLSKFEAALSNMLKKMAETQNTLTQNLK